MTRPSPQRSRYLDHYALIAAAGFAFAIGCGAATPAPSNYPSQAPLTYIRDYAAGHLLSTEEIKHPGENLAVAFEQQDDMLRLRIAQLELYQVIRISGRNEP